MRRRRPGARWRRAGVALLGASLLAGAARAEEPRRIELGVLVSHISGSAGRPGWIDPGARDLDSKLQGQVPYDNMKVLVKRQVKLSVDELWSTELPNRRTLRVRPIDLDDRGVLLAVSVEGAVQTDLRVRNGRRVVIGGDRYEGGKLVISLTPSW